MIQFVLILNKNSKQRSKFGKLEIIMFKAEINPIKNNESNSFFCLHLF